MILWEMIAFQLPAMIKLLLIPSYSLPRILLLIPGAILKKGYLKRKEIERFIPSKKQDPLYLADSLLNKKHKNEKYFSDINEPYKLLSEQLKKYADIAKKRWLAFCFFRTRNISQAMLPRESPP